MPEVHEIEIRDTAAQAQTAAQSLRPAEDLQDIALRRFMVIGEAASHVSMPTKERFPQIDWLAARGMRNFVAHEYFRVDAAQVWNSVNGDVPSLLSELPSIIAQVKADEQATRARGV